MPGYGEAFAIGVVFSVTLQGFGSVMRIFLWGLASILLGVPQSLLLELQNFLLLCFSSVYLLDFHLKKERKKELEMAEK